jgi:hypothetical protein
MKTHTLSFVLCVSLLLGNLQIFAFGASDEKSGYFYIEASQTNILTSFSQTGTSIGSISYSSFQAKDAIKAFGANVTIGRQFDKRNDVRLEVGAVHDPRATFCVTRPPPLGVETGYTATVTYKATLIPIISTYNFSVPIYRDKVMFGLGASLGAIYARLEPDDLREWFGARSVLGIKRNQWDFVYGFNASLKANFTERLFGRLSFGYFNSSNLGSPKQLSVSVGWKL